MAWQLERFGRDWNDLAERNPFGAIWPDDAGRLRVMFGMPHDEVLSLIRDAGGCVVAVIPDQSHGPSPQGYEYWVRHASP